MSADELQPHADSEASIHRAGRVYIFQVPYHTVVVPGALYISYYVYRITNTLHEFYSEIRYT